LRTAAAGLNSRLIPPNPTGNQEQAPMTRRSLSRFSMYAAIGLLAISAIKKTP
jgi:hypothetical protein